MKKIHKALVTFYIITVAVLFLVSCTGIRNNKGTIYFISQNGDDNNSGQSSEDPWQTIDKINSIELNPGDKVLFEGGSTFQGTLSLDGKDAGEPGSRIMIGSYGKGMATIDGNNLSAISADSCSYLSITRLILRGSGRNDGNTEDGLIITRSDSIILDSLEAYGFQHSGILLDQSSNSSITNSYAHDNGFAGIHVTGKSAWDSAKFDNHNIYIGYCKAENNPGDPSVLTNHSGSGILASSVDSGLIEYCEAVNNGWAMPWNGNGPVGIWIWDCSHVTIQYCIAHDNKTSKGAADGGGFDFDGGVSESTLQYCLSYNNEGPGIGLFEFGAVKHWENNIIRYNISQDDGKTGMASLSIWRGDAGGVIRNCEIYNNVLYNSNPDGVSLNLMNNWPGFNFRNNIFIYNGSFLYKGKKLENEVFQRNCYWNLKEDKKFLDHPDLETWARKTGKEMKDGEFIGFYQHPDFEVIGKATLTDPRKLTAEFFKEYSLKAGSVLIDAGLDLKNFGIDPGKNDLLKNPVPQGKAYDIGAIEHD